MLDWNGACWKVGEVGAPLIKSQESSADMDHEDQDTRLLNQPAQEKLLERIEEGRRKTNTKPVPVSVLYVTTGRLVCTSVSAALFVLFV